VGEAIETAPVAETEGETPALAPLGGVLARIRIHEPSCTPVERRIIAAIRANGRELVGLPIEELASRIGVSTTSIVRFCRRLGYRGLRELMLALAAEVLGETAPEAPPIAPEDGTDAIVRKVTIAAQQALAASADVLDRAAIDRAVKALLAARRIQFFGIGGSGPIAQDADYRFARLGLPVSVRTDAQLQPIVASRLGPDAVAFVISHTGRSIEPVHVLEEAKRGGATTILLTSFANTPAARWADIVLLTAPVATAPWDGMAPLRVAQLTVIDILCVAIAARGAEELRDFRSRYDALLERHMLPGGSGPDQTGATVAAPAPVEHAVIRPAQPSDQSRQLSIEGVVNARHLGWLPRAGEGKTTQVVLRSGAIEKVTPAGIRHLQLLGVTDIVDLRSADEFALFPNPSLEHAGIAVVHAPMWYFPSHNPPDHDDRAAWIAVYRAWAEQSQAAMRTLLETIARARGSVLMSCYWGADRTGVAAALLLDLVGVAEADILADFLLTPNSHGYEVLISAMLARVRERWGSTAAYFADSGVDEATLARARARIEGRLVI
jgi:DNA-binding MurR/RpiR family transcriptional regulator